MNRLFLKRLSLISVAATATAVLLLALLSMALLHMINTADRKYVSNHVLANLDSVVNLINLVAEDDINRVRVIAEAPDLVARASAVLEQPQNKSAVDALEAWTTTSYRSRGFVGYSVINLDYLVVVASSPAYVGKPASAAGRAVMEMALAVGAAISRPTASMRPVVNDGQQLPEGAMYQLACARIIKQGAAIGFLCLRSDPTIRLFKLLEAARTGETGEAYVIDAEGRILSPSRFKRNTEAASNPSSEWNPFRLSARAPELQRRDGRASAAGGAGKVAPLTRVAQRLLQDKSVSTGYLENYSDYRGKRVVGAGQWLPDIGMGVIVEEDWAEAFYANQISHYTVLTLTVVAVTLIISLGLFQRRARHSLAQSEERYRAFRENSPNGSILRDVHGVIQIANRAYDDFHDVPHGSLIGRTDWEVFPNEIAKIYVAAHEKTLRSRTSLEQVQYLASWGMTVRILSFPVSDVNDGEVIGIGMVINDISAQVKAQQELEALNRDLESRVDARTKELAEARDAAEAGARAKADFLANMSHEIRTPMNAIIGMSYLALSGTLAPQARNYVEKIRGAGQHLLGIINSILDFSKIEAGKFVVDAAPFSLQQLIENVIGFVWDEAESKELEFLLELDPKLPSAFIGDSLRIGQILINFCNNAVKFTEAGEVALRISHAGLQGDAIRMRFEVSDTGVGISEAALRRLFEPFYQVDNSSTRQFEGTGLGLAICKSLAELLGGSISARSTPGVGSTFTFDVALPPAAQQPVPAVSLPPIPLRALVIDDNAHARALLGNILRSFSCSVAQAETFEQALALQAQAHSAGAAFNLVFIDWKMPGADALEIARRLRDANGESAYFILMTPHISVSAADVENATPFSAHIGKPLSPSAVFDVIAKLLLPGYAATTRQTAARPPVDLIDLSGTRVLLVEDNDINQEVAVAILRSFGMRVSVAGNGADAVKMVRAEPFDVVLMDIQMPVLDGFSATQAIRADTNSTQPLIIAMTANALPGDREHCLEAGMNDYVAKPIEPATLLSTLSHWLGKSRAENAAPPNSSVGSSRLPHAMLQSLGLDTDKALGLLLGRESLYARIMQRFIEERAELPQQLDDALQTGDFATAANLMHALKSLAGTLGAYDLQKICTAIEHSLGSAFIDREQIHTFNAEIARLMQGLRPLLHDFLAAQVVE